MVRMQRIPVSSRECTSIELLFYWADVKLANSCAFCRVGSYLSYLSKAVLKATRSLLVPLHFTVQVLKKWTFNFVKNVGYVGFKIPWISIQNTLNKCRPEAATPPPPLHIAMADKNNLNEEITPPPPYWDRREILPNRFNVQCSYADVNSPPINESAELTQGGL